MIDLASKNSTETAHVGEYISENDTIIANKDKKTIKVNVANTGDRPIQVGSHTHFAEANKALEFNREKSLGYHLNIPAGTSIRFEPGETKHVSLVEFGGTKTIYGLSGMVDGQLNEKRQEAIKNFHDNKAAIMVEEKGMKGNIVEKKISKLFNNLNQLESMGLNARELIVKDANKKIIKQIVHLLKK